MLVFVGAGTFRSCDEIDSAVVHVGSFHSHTCITVREYQYGSEIEMLLHTGKWKWNLRSCKKPTVRVGNCELPWSCVIFDCLFLLGFMSHIPITFGADNATDIISCGCRGLKSTLAGHDALHRQNMLPVSLHQHQSNRPFSRYAPGDSHLDELPWQDTFCLWRLACASRNWPNQKRRCSQSAAFGSINIWQRGGWMSCVTAMASGHVPSEPVEESLDFMLSKDFVNFSPCWSSGLVSTPEERGWKTADGASQHIKTISHLSIASIFKEGFGGVAQEKDRIHIQHHVASCMEAFHQQMQATWDSFLNVALDHMRDVLAEIGIAAEIFFRTGALVLLLHMLRMLAFTIPLKGGRMNWDPLIVACRSITAWTPWGFVSCIEGFSPRLASQTRAKTACKAMRGMSFSKDLWIFILLVSSMCEGVSAGAGNRHNVDCTGFRANRRARKLGSAIINTRWACRNINSPPTPPDEPPQDGPPPDDNGEGDGFFNTDSYLLQFFSIGCLPQFLVSAFFPGTSLHQVIEQVTNETAIPPSPERGAFIPAKGVPFRDALVLLWLPEWLTLSEHCLLFIDASLLGLSSFTILYTERTVTYAGLAEHLWPLWEAELGHIYAFVPFFSELPLGELTQCPAVHGLTVALQRDAFPPSCIPDPDEAFRQYKLWGADVEDADQPPRDMPWPVDKIQMSLDGVTRLYSVGSAEPTIQLVGCLARRFTFGEGELDIKADHGLPDRYVWYGEPVSRLAAVCTSTPPLGSVCVFLVLRGIGCEGRAAWITQDEFSRSGILEATGVAVNEVPGYKIRVSGGTSENGSIVYRHGDLLFFNFVPSDVLTDYSSGSEDDDYSDYEDESDQHSHHMQSVDDSFQAAQEPRSSREDQIIWNPQRDTSTGRNGDRLSTLPLMLGRRGSARRSPGRESRQSVATTGIRLYLAGIALLQTFVGGGSVMLPFIDPALQEDISPSTCDTVMRDALPSGCHDGAQGWYGYDSHHSVGQWDSPAYCNGDTCESAIMYGETAVPEFTGERLFTLLEEAKTHGFYELCGELAWFISRLPGAPIDNKDDACVQCTYNSTDSRQDVLPVPTHSCKTTHNPQILSLAELLECKATQASEPPACHMTCEANLEMLEWLQEGYLLERMSLDVAGIGSLHDSSTRALSNMRLWNVQEYPEEIKLFTDGSFCAETHGMAWSVVAVVRTHEEWKFAGFFSGSVAASELMQWTPSAYVAEIFAILHAMVLSSTRQQHTTILYDCTSAAEVARHASKQFSDISQQLSALAVILRQLGRWPNWSHIKGHSGDPFNELADCVAKAACKGIYTHSPHDEDRVLIAILERWLVWLWPQIAAQQNPFCWPRFEQDGRIYEPQSLVPREFLSCSNPTQPRQQPPENSNIRGASVELQFATYNCLSMKLIGQAECIEEFCVKRQMHVVGFQETKVQWSGPMHSTHFLRFGSAANQQGHEGCQLWFRKGICFGTSASGESFGWDFSSFAVIHESERCLVVSAKAGEMEFVCISAHAHTTMSKQGDVQEFWGFLSRIVVSLPPKAIRLFFLDANAHFDEWVPVNGHYLPTNLNAQLLTEFAHAHSLTISDLWTPAGEAIHTWVSHQGHYKCLDFLAVPRCFQGCFQVQGSWDVLDRFAGFDHFMLGATLRFFQEGPDSHRRQQRFDCRDMCSPEGQAKLDEIFHHMPQIPWSVHATQHWDTVCGYLQQSCAQAFPQNKQGPKKSYIDDQTWELLGDQKSVRYIMRFRKIFVAKQFLAACFTAWRLQECGVGHSYSAPHVGCSLAKVLRSHNFCVAVLWQRLQKLKRQIGQAMQTCQAARVRASFDDARTQGPRAMAQLMASITKKGRRFKAPKMLPPLIDDNGRVMTNKAAVLEKLGDFFAKAEKAQKMHCQDYAAQAENILPPTHSAWRAAEIPHVGTLANAFRRLKNGKAPGGSGLPPEIFSQASQSAAMALFPLYLKGVFRHEFATGLLGSSVVAIPKPNKNPHNPAGWRSIALQECVAKAISSMFRGDLVQAFTRQADTAQLGGRPKGPLGFPAHLIQAHVRRMAVKRRSSAVIFVDGSQAFYSVFREVIVGCDDHQQEAKALVKLVHSLSEDEVVREDLFKVLVGPTVLQQGGVSPAVCSYMQAGLRNTFYRVDPDSDVVYRTLVGTVPGAPLADVLYQLAMVRFHSRVRDALAEHDLQVKVMHPVTQVTLTSSVPAWVDDIAVPIEALSTNDLIPRVIKAMCIVEEKLRCTGVDVNFCRGKTEVLVAWRGEGTKKMRQQWGITSCGRVEVPLLGKPGVSLHLVDRYVHLGSLVHASGHVVGDIRHRASLARASFKAIRARLLRNPCLSQTEKVRLIIQGPVAGFLHGAGTWVMCNGRKGQAYKVFCGVLVGFMRSSLRPITGWSPRGLTDEEVCLLLRVLPPRLTLVVARLRHLASVAAWLDDYSLVVLVEEEQWLRAVMHDLGELKRVVDLGFLLPSSLCFRQWKSFLAKLVIENNAFRLAIRAAIRKWSDGDDSHRQKVTTKATALTELYNRGGVMWHERERFVGDRTFACSVCHRLFFNKAALGSHCARIHGVGSKKHALGALTACQKCGVEFWTVARLWDHVRRRPGCLDAVLESDCYFGKADNNTVDAVLRPATSLIGPKPFWACLSPKPHTAEAQGTCTTTDLQRWQKAWNAFVQAQHSNINPNNLSSIIRQFCQDVGWRKTAFDGRLLQDSLGAMCLALIAGQGSVFGLHIMSRDNAWAICQEGMQAVAAAAISF